MTQYRIVKVEISYPPGKVARPGDIVSDIPKQSVDWLLREGLIAPVHTEQQPQKKVK